MVQRNSHAHTQSNADSALGVRPQALDEDQPGARSEHRRVVEEDCDSSQGALPAASGVLSELSLTFLSFSVEGHYHKPVSQQTLVPL